MRSCLQRFSGGEEEGAEPGHEQRLQPPPAALLTATGSEEDSKSTQGTDRDNHGSLEEPQL